MLLATTHLTIVPLMITLLHYIRAYPDSTDPSPGEPGALSHVQCVCSLTCLAIFILATATCFPLS